MEPACGRLLAEPGLCAQLPQRTGPAARGGGAQRRAGGGRGGTKGAGGVTGVVRKTAEAHGISTTRPLQPGKRGRFFCRRVTGSRHVPKRVAYLPVWF
ncbi:MAG: hypothetical protein RIQ93_1566 [Verrucomicrobiota bacterium]|jgi:hypothetical protein